MPAVEGGELADPAFGFEVVAIPFFALSENFPQPVQLTLLSQEVFGA